MLLLDINNTSIAVIFALFLGIVFIVYILLSKLFMHQSAEKGGVTIFKKILIVLLSIALAYLFLSIKYWVTGKGLLE